MKRLEILFDVDDVIVDFADAFIKFVAEHGVTCTKNDLTDHDFFKAINRLDLEIPWRKRIEQGGYVSSLKPLPGALENIKSLQKNHDVYACTAPSHVNNWMFERMEWLITHAGISHKMQHHTHAKFAVGGDVFVDDRTSNLKKYVDRNPNTMLILFDQPSNRHDNDPRFNRARNWEEVMAFIETKSLYNK